MSDDGEARIASIIHAAEEIELRGAANGDGGKPKIVVDHVNPDVTVAALRDALAASGLLFERGVIVRAVEDVQRGAMTLHPVSPEGLVRLAHSLCRPVVVKTSQTGQRDLVDCRLPRAIAVMYLDWKGEWGLSPLNGISSAPILAADGSIRTAAGYDPTTGFWLENVPKLERLLPRRPTRADAELALRVLRETFASFCFADAVMTSVPDIEHPLVDIDEKPGADESAFLTALLTAVCRPSLALAPGILITAAPMSGAGSGKGLLARAIGEIAFGCEPRAVTGGGNAQELEKRIAAELIAGGSMLFLDNLNDRALRSDLLASAITERATRVRILGRSEMVALNSTAFVVLTGNGLTVAEDLARRFIRIELDPRTESPEARRFDGNIRAEIMRRRPELLAAALTIWRWGRLQTELEAGQVLGSFEQWCSWVRDPLLALGCSDPALRTSEAKQRDSGRQFTAEVFVLWQQRHGGNPVTAHQLAEDIKALLDPQGRGRQYLAPRVEAAGY